MKAVLEHKSYRYESQQAVIDEIDALAEQLDQKHPLERKVRFLLDIRGYLYLNRICGNYIEFGSFKSEMQYAAFKILDGTGAITAYLGLDIFTGEPDLNPHEATAMPVTASGDFSCDFEQVQQFVQQNMAGKGELIRGDFREKTLLQKCDAFAPFNIAVIDCNLLSSLEVATRYALQNLTDGGLLFFDDYFTNFGQGVPRIPRMVQRLAAVSGRKLLEHGFYPPFAKSFIVCSE